jgi:hypothetical protein
MRELVEAVPEGPERDELAALLPLALGALRPVAASAAGRWSGELTV